jgi:hypothetical protein
LSYSVYVRGAAERDVAEAQHWYEQQQAGLAADLNAEFGAVLTRLAENPFIYPHIYREARPTRSNCRHGFVSLVGRLESKTKADMNAARQSTASAYLSDAARLTVHWCVLAS